MKTLFDDLTSPWHRPQLIEKGVQAMVKKKVKTTIVRRCKKKRSIDLSTALCFALAHLLHPHEDESVFFSSFISASKLGTRKRLLRRES